MGMFPHHPLKIQGCRHQVQRLVMPFLQFLALAGFQNEADNFFFSALYAFFVPYFIFSDHFLNLSLLFIVGISFTLLGEWNIANRAIMRFRQQ
jgi:hypothetical protein